MNQEEHDKAMQALHEEKYRLYQNFYSHSFRCINCGQTATIEIPKGRQIRDHPCPNCGVKGRDAEK